MLTIIALCVVMYAMVAVVTSGVIDTLKNYRRNYTGRWSKEDSGWVGVGWPISFIWYLLLKPIMRFTMHLTQWHLDRVHTRVRIREEKQQEERQRIAEVEEIMAREAEDQHQARV
jgi:hypothetical protein